VEVSWVLAFFNGNQRVYDKHGADFHIVSVEAGPKSVQKTFRNYPADWTTDCIRNAFWTLERSCGCNTVVAVQLSVCKALVDMGISLVHNGIRVNNFYAVNGGFDISDLEEITVTVTDPEDPKNMFRTGLYSTVPDLAKLASFPDRVCQLLGRASPVGNDDENTRVIADYLKIPIDKYVVHWWCCFVLDNGTMAHMDLCGPAYGMFSYAKRAAATCGASYDDTSNEAPVCIVESPALCVAPLDPSAAERFPHKLQMTRQADDGCGLRMIRLPPTFRPYAHEKINPEITPTDCMLDRHAKDLAGFADEIKSIVNQLGRQAIGRSCVPSSPLRSASQTMMVRLCHISKRPELNGQSATVLSISGDRVAVQLQSGEGIRLLPSTLVFENSTTQSRQLLSLTEMKTSAERLVNEAGESRLDPGDMVKIEGLQSATQLNGLDAIVVDSDAEAARYIVRIPSMAGEHKRIRRDNLRLQKRHEADAAEASALQVIRDYLDRDHLGNKFFNRVFMTANIGLTNVTDPEILPAFEKLVQMQVGTLFLKSPSQQRQWEVIVKMTKKQSWGEFREVVQQLRTGTLEPQRFESMLARNAELRHMYEICMTEGILKIRSA